MAFFTPCGIDRILTDNAWPCRKSTAWQQALTDPTATGELTRICRPQTNGKVEHSNRTLLDEWAYLRPCTSNTERTPALESFLHTCNRHRCHAALAGRAADQPREDRIRSLHLVLRRGTSAAQHQGPAPAARGRGGTRRGRRAKERGKPKPSKRSPEREEPR